MISLVLATWMLMQSTTAVQIAHPLPAPAGCTVDPLGDTPPWNHLAWWAEQDDGTQTITYNAGTDQSWSGTSYSIATAAKKDGTHGVNVSGTLSQFGMDGEGWGRTGSCDPGPCSTLTKFEDGWTWWGWVQLRTGVGSADYVMQIQGNHGNDSDYAHRTWIQTTGNSTDGWDLIGAVTTSSHEKTCTISDVAPTYTWIFLQLWYKSSGGGSMGLKVNGGTAHGGSECTNTTITGTMNWGNQVSGCFYMTCYIDTMGMSWNEDFDAYDYIVNDGCTTSPK